METKTDKKIVLFSVDELKDIDKFAKILINNGWTVLATDLPYDLLKGKGIPVTSVYAFTGQADKYKFPSTLHPKIEAALTMNDFPERIDLVYDITYGPQDGLDVGGNTLLALAVKGRRIPVTSLKSMRLLIDEISRCGDVSYKTRENLIEETTNKIAEYFIHIAETASQDKIKYLKTECRYDLINGENPYQTASLWSLQDGDDLALTKYRLLSDNKPCYTNLADLDSITETLIKLCYAFRLHYNKQPYITITAKHGNACGIGIDWESRDISIERALWGNPVAVWGGEIIMNFGLGLRESTLLVSSDKRKELFGKGNWMFDVVAAPYIDDQACDFLATNKKTKIFVNESLSHPLLATANWSYRFARGAILRQSKTDYIIDIKVLDWNISEPSLENLDDILIAWAAAFSSFHGGNEIAISQGRKLLSCAGGPSTVDSAETAVSRANKFHGDLYGASFAADAFFPFIDAPKILYEAGTRWGVVPMGGKNHQKISEYFKVNKINIGFLSEQYRGFCRH